MQLLPCQPCTRKTAASRRVAEFAKRDVGRRLLITHLVTIDTDLSTHPRRKLVSGAIRFFVALCHGGDASKICMMCKAPFILDALSPYAFLISIPVSPNANAASVSGICRPCFEAASVAEIDAACELTLQAILPHGRFIDPATDLVSDGDGA
jgi:hypothetical protein